PTTHLTLTDEGTMMLEEVHAIAPGANLAFCGPDTSMEFLGCMQNLIAAGADIISDDIAYRGFDVFTAPSANGQLGTLLTSNPAGMLFHGVGNDNTDYDQDVFNPTALGSPALCNSNGTSQTDYYLHAFSASASYIVWNTVGGNSLYVASPVTPG